MIEKTSSPAKSGMNNGITNSISRELVNEIKQQIYAELGLFDGNRSMGGYGFGNSYSFGQGQMPNQMGMYMMPVPMMGMMPFYGAQMGMNPQMGNMGGYGMGFGQNIRKESLDHRVARYLDESRPYFKAIRKRKALERKSFTVSSQKSEVTEVVHSDDIVKYQSISEEPRYMMLLRKKRVKLVGDWEKDIKMLTKAAHKYTRKTNLDYRLATKWRSPVKLKERAILAETVRFEYRNKRPITCSEIGKIREMIYNASYTDPNYFAEPEKSKGIFGSIMKSTISGISKAKPAVMAGL
jgi:hypothetical protein